MNMYMYMYMYMCMCMCMCMYMCMYMYMYMYMSLVETVVCAVARQQAVRACQGELRRADFCQVEGLQADVPGRQADASEELSAGLRGEQDVGPGERLLAGRARGRGRRGRTPAGRHAAAGAFRRVRVLPGEQSRRPGEPRRRPRGLGRAGVGVREPPPPQPH